MIEALIRQVPLFAGLPEAEVRRLAESLHSGEYPEGSVLFREGEHGDRFFLVLEGRLEVIKALGTPEERRLSTRGRGEYLGEMSLFSSDGLRTATVRTLTAARLLEMTRADFDALLNRQPMLAYDMVRVLSARLNNAHNVSISELSEKNRQLSEAYQALQAAQAQIVEKEKMEHEMSMARGVQAGLLPGAAPSLPGWEFAIGWQPARAVSGDFYDFVPLGQGPQAGLGLVIADVSDKGMPAALFMALARSIVRASASGCGSPAECIRQANRLISADAGASGMFVTLFYGQLDPGGQLAYVNAGHNPPWLLRAGGDRPVEELKRTGMALGFFAEQPLTQRNAQLQPGDLLVLYTDGVTDVMDPQGERFGRERLEHVLRAQAGAPAAEVLGALERAARDFRGPAELADDFTAVIARRL